MSDTPISDSTPHNVADLGMLCRRLERELTAANERIKRLEDALEARASDNELNEAWELYIKTKEAKL
jgi:predicted  nucleic acid-binding Zn-ribbon protein